MASKAYLNVDEIEALIPRRLIRLTPVHIAVTILLLEAMLGLAWLLELSDQKRHVYLAAAAAVIVLVPVLARLLSRPAKVPWIPPLAMDRNRMVGPGILTRGLYVTWPEVSLIALVHSLVGPNPEPIEHNLLIYRKNKHPARISVPTMSQSEFQKFVEILERIAEIHDIELVFDDNQMGQRRLRQLPWAF